MIDSFHCHIALFTKYQMHAVARRRCDTSSHAWSSHWTTRPQEHPHVFKVGMLGIHKTLPSSLNKTSSETKTYRWRLGAQQTVAIQETFKTRQLAAPISMTFKSNRLTIKRLSRFRRWKNTWRSGDQPETLPKLWCWSKGGRPLAAHPAEHHLEAALTVHLNTLIAKWCCLDFENYISATNFQQLSPDLLWSPIRWHHPWIAWVAVKLDA